jgi:hypothetical protein
LLQRDASKVFIDFYLEQLSEHASLDYGYKWQEAELHELSMLKDRINKEIDHFEKRRPRACHFFLKLLQKAVWQRKKVFWVVLADTWHSRLGTFCEATTACMLFVLDERGCLFNALRAPLRLCLPIGKDHLGGTR